MVDAMQHGSVRVMSAENLLWFFSERLDGYFASHWLARILIFFVDKIRDTFWKSSLHVWGPISTPDSTTVLQSTRGVHCRKPSVFQGTGTHRVHRKYQKYSADIQSKSPGSSSENREQPSICMSPRPHQLPLLSFLSALILLFPHTFPGVVSFSESS